MGKLIATLVMVVAAFLLAVVIPMAATGKLNKESIDKIRGVEVTLEAEEPDPATPLLQSLEAERERLNELAADLAKREELLTLREQELSSTLQEVTQMQASIAAAMDEMDADQQERMMEVAKTLGSMKATNAADDLESMTPEQAAVLLPLIDERARGKILDAMDDLQHRSLILQIMQESKY